MVCEYKFGCHACQNSLKIFIKIGDQALELKRIGEVNMAMKELKSAVEMARIIAYASENKDQED